MSVGKNVFWQTQLPGNLEKSFGPLRLSILVDESTTEIR